MVIGITKEARDVLTRARDVVRGNESKVFLTAVTMFLLVPRNPTTYSAGRGAAFLVNNERLPAAMLAEVEAMAERYETSVGSLLAAALNDYAQAKVNAQTREEFMEQYSR